MIIKRNKTQLLIFLVVGTLILITGTLFQILYLNDQTIITIDAKIIEFEKTYLYNEGSKKGTTVTELIYASIQYEYLNDTYTKRISFDSNTAIYTNDEVSIELKKDDPENITIKPKNKLFNFYLFLIFVGVFLIMGSIWNYFKSDPF